MTLTASAPLQWNLKKAARARNHWICQRQQEKINQWDRNKQKSKCYFLTMDNWNDIDLVSELLPPLSCNDLFRPFSLYFVSVLDRYLPFVEPRKLPGCPEPALPLQSGVGAWYSSLQQVCCLCSSLPFCICPPLYAQSTHSASITSFYCWLGKFTWLLRRASGCKWNTLISFDQMWNLLEGHQRIKAYSWLARPITSDEREIFSTIHIFLYTLTDGSEDTGIYSKRSNPSSLLSNLSHVVLY